MTLWSVRGAPHAHPVTHLDFVRDALAPRATDDGGAYVEAVDEVAAAMRDVVTAPTPKSTASGETSARAWRYRRNDNELTITTFDGLAPGRRTEVENRAQLVAQAAGDDELAVTWA